MGHPSTPPSGSLARAAEVFERELARYEKIAAELTRNPVRSQKTLARTQKLLTDSAECEQALGVHLRALLEAMNGSRDKQQQAMEQTLAAARALETRAVEFSTLIERVAALGTRARDTSGPAMEALAESKESEQGGVLMRSLEQLGDRMRRSSRTPSRSPATPRAATGPTSRATCRASSSK